MNKNIETQAEPRAIISFKKFLVGRYTENETMMQEAAMELSSYSGSEVQAFGAAMAGMQKEVMDAKSNGTLDELCKKYAADVANAESKDCDGN